MKTVETPGHISTSVSKKATVVRSNPQDQFQNFVKPNKAVEENI